MKQIRLCVFDMDGLLIDSEKVYLINALKTSEVYGYGLSREFIISTIGLNATETRKRYLQVNGEDFPFEEFMEKEWVFHEEYLRNNPMEKKKGVDELFEFLDSNHIQKALATSTSRKHALSYLESVDLENCFDHIVFGDDLTESKPRPEIYLKAISAFPYEKDEIFAFEDSSNGILSAYNAGLNVIHIPDISYVSDEVKEKSFIVLDDLTQAIKLIQDINQR